jgi:hypothetical protein
VAKGKGKACTKKKTRSAALAAKDNTEGDVEGGVEVNDDALWLGTKSITPLKKKGKTQKKMSNVLLPKINVN